MILGAILVCTKVQSDISYFVLFNFSKAEEQGSTGGMDISDQHLPSILYSSSANKKTTLQCLSLSMTLYKE